MISIPAQKASVLLLFGLFCFAGIMPLCAQNVGINTTGATPKSSAILDLTPNTTHGFLPPKVALTDTNAAAPITNPVNGLLVFDTSTTFTGNNGTEGFYYWNANATNPDKDWVRLQSSSTTQPYGYNIQYVVGTSDQTTTSISSGPPVQMPQMTITFIPVHATVYVTFSASGYTDYAGATDANQYIVFEIFKNGAVATPSGLGSANGYETTTICEAGNTNAGSTYNSGWSCCMTLPVSVTAGTAVTISIGWYTIGAEAQNTIENLVSSVPNRCHRTLFIND